ELPFEIDELVCQLLEKDPARRPADGLVLLKQLERVRRKLERKANPTLAEPRHTATRADDEAAQLHEAEGEPGPSTLMSRLTRGALTDSRRGNPLSQVLNQPWVLVLLLAACGS